MQNEQDRQMNANLVISAIQSLGVRTHGSSDRIAAMRAIV